MGCNMSLKSIELKRAYDSDRDDMLREFYIPVLSKAIYYKRLAGFFSSTSLAVAAKGITQFIKNGGQMELICSARLSKEDVEAIQRAHENPSVVLEKSSLQDFEAITEDFVREHVKALGWMIANGNLSIKIAFVVDESGTPLSEEAITRHCIFHQKVGIIEDSEGNILSFSGSDNESASAWEGHIEEFKVFRGWIEAEEPYLLDDLEKFKRFWNGLGKRTVVIDAPKAIKDKLIQIAPKDFYEIDLERWEKKSTQNRKTVTLWEHQNSAIDAWIENGMNGIFEMATGTGKTFTALGCLKRILDENRIGITVIACPYDHLVKQWVNDIVEFGLTTKIIIADSSNSNWKDELANYLLEIKRYSKKSLIILTTHDTLSSIDFIKIIRMSDVDKLLIVDEVHGIGAPERKKGLLDDYRFRLGLSATPRRWFDDEGTKVLFDFFDKTVFEFSLEQAIQTINPATRETYLVPYDYIPFFVDLNDDELNQYEKMTAKISRLYNSAKNDDERSRILSLLCIRRQEIIKNAANKYSAFRSILSEIDFPTAKHCLVYCSPEQIDNVQDILNEYSVVQHKFTMSEGTHKEDKYGGQSEREFLLSKFEEGTYQVLVAIKCLDEGVDVPPARTAIIMASTGNPREWIQRRGRILRRHSGKKKATIYDLVVVPYLHERMTGDIEFFEKKILQNELKRYKEFAKIASNSLSCLNKIYEVEKKFGI